MTQYPSNEELVREFVHPVTEDVYSAREFHEKTGIASPGTISRWIRELEAGELRDLVPRLRRDLLEYLGYLEPDIPPARGDNSNESDAG